MAVGTTAVWRARPSGASDNNGGGYDCGSSGGSLTPAATGSNGSWATSSGVTTFTDATAAAFTSGMVGASIRIDGLGQFLITGYVSASAIHINTPSVANSTFGTSPGTSTWAVGPSGSQDYSQQSAAVHAPSGTLSTSAANSTALLDSGNGFTSAMVGNAINITAGTNFTAGFYFITAFTSAGNVTLDRSPTPSAAGSGGSGNIGGAWATPWGNLSALVAGNIFYLLGGASPTFASPDYYAAGNQNFGATGNSTNGYVKVLGDPATPSSNGHAGLPVIKINSGYYSLSGAAYSWVEGLWFYCGEYALSFSNSDGTPAIVKNCIFDQYGLGGGGVACYTGTYNGDVFVIGCEFFNSQSNSGSAPAIGSVGGYGSPGYGLTVIGCNIHDWSGAAIQTNKSGTIEGNIIANCRGNGIEVTTTSYAPAHLTIKNNTIDGAGSNSGHGIAVDNSYNITIADLLNNIISNHQGSGKYGIYFAGTSATTNNALRALVDYNVFYNNTQNYYQVAPGPHDTLLTTSPYVNSATEDYTLA